MSLAPALTNLFKCDELMRSILKNLRLIWTFLRTRKKWWLTPIIVFLLLLSLVLVSAQGSAIAPFIYTLF